MPAIASHGKNALRGLTCRRVDRKCDGHTDIHTDKFIFCPYIVLDKQKLRFFAFLEAVGPPFFSQNGEIWYEGADLGLIPPSQIYTKNYQFRRFWVL